MYIFFVKSQEGVAVILFVLRKWSKARVSHKNVVKGQELPFFVGVVRTYVLYDVQCGQKRLY